MEMDQLWLGEQEEATAPLQTTLVFPMEDETVPRRAFIYTAGHYQAEDIVHYGHIRYNPTDLIICADGGYDTVRSLGLSPHIVIGDMDSICNAPPPTVETQIHPVAKDKTDLYLCIDYALQQRCNEIYLLGAFGGRIDHSMSAMFAMRYIVEQGAQCMLLTARSRVYLVSSRLVVQREDYSKISLIPLTDRVEGVTTTNLWFPLEDATLRQEDCLGVSNEFASEQAEISLTKGLLFVICERE